MSFFPNYRVLARKLGPRQSRGNAVLPRYFLSVLSRNLSEAKWNQIIKGTPLGRLAKMLEICPKIDFLMSEKASLITGQTIIVDGGLTV